MALIDLRKLKDEAAKAAALAKEKADKAGVTEAVAKANAWTAQAAKDASSQTSELSAKAIRAMLKGVDLDRLLGRVDEYQQKTGKDASKLIEFIKNLKQLQQDGTGNEG